MLGVQTVVRTLCAVKSDVLMKPYYPVFLNNRKLSPLLLPNYIKCYRYFKEGRNSQIHRGGKASHPAKQAYNDFSAVSDNRSLWIKGVLLHDRFVTGQPVKLHLRGVVGFSDILQRVMTTIYAELCRSIESENILERSQKGVSGQPHTLSAGIKRRNEQVLKRCTAAGLPKPSDLKAIYDFNVRQTYNRDLE
jgi:hypothetical protein